MIELAHAEFLSPLPSVHTVDTSYLVHQDIFYQAQLHQVSCHHLHHVANKHHFISDLHHLPSPSDQE